MVERKTLNLVVVGSSPTEGVYFLVVLPGTGLLVACGLTKSMSLDGRVV